MKQSNEILQLGQKLVDELEMRDGVDTLGRWMLHFLAEKLEQAASPQCAESEKRLCCELILDFWKHRSSLPENVRPFNNFERIFLAMDKLANDSVRPSFLRPRRQRIGNVAAPEDWLELADRIAQGSRLAIRYCISEANEVVKEQEADLLAVAMAMPGDFDDEIRAIIRLGAEFEFTKPETPAELRKTKAEQLLQGVDLLVEALSKLRNDLKAEIESVERAIEP